MGGRRRGRRGKEPRWLLGVATGAWREGSTRAEVGHGREKEVGEKCPKKPDPLIPPQPTKPTQDPLQPPLPGASHLAWVTLTAQQLRSAGAAAWSEKKRCPALTGKGLGRCSEVERGVAGVRWQY